MQAIARPIYSIRNPRWVSCAELASASVMLSNLLPHDIDAFVSVPRSGCLPATVMACLRQKPIWSFSDAKPVLLDSGRRKVHTAATLPRRIAVVEDFSNSGASIARAVEMTKESFPDAEIFPCSALGTQRAVNLNKITIAAVVHPLIFIEWTGFNSTFAMRGIATDMDGIICKDPRRADLASSESNVRWLQTAIPLNLPTRKPVQWIVTSRLERFRNETEKWLAKHGVQFHSLIMGPWESHEQRGNKSAVWKARTAIRIGCRAFVESDPRQAQLISKVAKIPVHCPSAGKTFGLEEK